MEEQSVQSNTAVTSKSNSNLGLFIVVFLAVVAGFVGGFFVARDRYIMRIGEISRMHMEKAVAVDSLRQELRVLGASTKAK